MVHRDLAGESRFFAKEKCPHWAAELLIWWSCLDRGEQIQMFWSIKCFQCFPENLRIQTQTWQLGAKQWKQFGRGRKQGREESDNQVSWRWRWQSKWRKESGNLILLIWKPLAVTKQFTFGISLTISSSELSGQEGRRAGLDEESWKELQRSPINNQPSPITSRTTMDIRPGENLRYLKLGRLNVKAFKYIQFEKIPQVRFSMSTGEGAQSSGSNVWDLLRWIQPGFSSKIM